MGRTIYSHQRSPLTAKKTKNGTNKPTSSFLTLKSATSPWPSQRFRKVGRRAGEERRTDSMESPSCITRRVRPAGKARRRRGRAAPFPANGSSGRCAARLAYHSMATPTILMRQLLPQARCPLQVLRNNVDVDRCRAEVPRAKMSDYAGGSWPAPGWSFMPVAMECLSWIGVGSRLPIEEFEPARAGSRNRDHQAARRPASHLLDRSC
jgi:hypothetical protein